MRSIIVAGMLLLTAMVAAPTVAADDGCEAQFAHYCIDAHDPVGTLKFIVEDIKNSPCTCDPMPEPW